MKTNIIYLCALVLLMMQTITFGQKTEVSVQKGKVIAQTAAGTVTVDAGRKAVLAQNENPIVTVDDPMVDDLIEIYKWVEDEKEEQRVRIDLTSIQIHSIDSEQLWTGAGLTEMPNTKSEPSDTCRIGLTSILKEPKYYDLEGNLLPFDMDKINARQGYYYLHFLKPVEPGDKFKFIGVSEFTASSNEIWKEGSLWYIRMGNCSPNCLNYFRIILPESAIFVDASRPVMIVDSFDGRTAVTIRNYTGQNADGMYQIAFLWPDKDGTTLADLPPKYRGLRNKRDAELAKEYRREMAKILDGELFQDQSTPLRTLLTINSAIVKKDKDLLIGASYILQENTQLAEQINGMWDKLENMLVANLDFLSTAIWPKEPQNDDIHLISLCRKGSLFREFTIAFIYNDGKWYQVGDVSGPEPKDVNDFQQVKAKSPKFEAIPWDNAGSEAIELYKEYVEKNTEYPGNWCALGIKLVGGSYWDQAFDAFQRCEKLHKKQEGIYYFAALVWQGHIYDLRGQRDKAIAKYKAALKVKGYGSMRHDQWGIVLNYKWVKERLEKPFNKEMIGK